MQGCISKGRRDHRAAREAARRHGWRRPLLPGPPEGDIFGAGARIEHGCPGPSPPAPHDGDLDRALRAVEERQPHLGGVAAKQGQPMVDRLQPGPERPGAGGHPGDDLPDDLAVEARRPRTICRPKAREARLLRHLEVGVGGAAMGGEVERVGAGRLGEGRATPKGKKAQPSADPVELNPHRGGVVGHGLGHGPAGARQRGPCGEGGGGAPPSALPRVGGRRAEVSSRGPLGGVASQHEREQRQRDASREREAHGVLLQAAPGWGRDRATYLRLSPSRS